MLYAVGLGLGLDADARNKLRFIYEDQLRVLPTLSTVLGYPGFWIADPGTGIDSRQVLHGEQSLENHAVFPVRGEVIGRTRIDQIFDKGPGKGALLYAIREVRDRRTSG